MLLLTLHLVYKALIDKKHLTCILRREYEAVSDGLYDLRPYLKQEVDIGGIVLLIPLETSES